MALIAKQSRAAVLSALLLVAGLAAAPAARACMCLEPPPPAQAMEQAGAVFSGRCVKVERTERETAYGKLPQLRAVLEVKAAWKGLDGQTLRPRTVVVWTGGGGGDCGFGFEAGESYLVYAHQAEDGTLSTDICTRSRDSGRAAGDLEALGEPTWVAETTATD